MAANKGLGKRSLSLTIDNSVAEGRGKSTKMEASSRDPLTYLNSDVIEILLSYLSIADLSRCECVSQLWKDMIKDFSARLGTLLHFPHLRNPALPSASAYDYYKWIAPYYHAVTNGRPTSVLKFDIAPELLCLGKFVVLGSLSFPGYTSQVDWQSLETLEDGSLPEPKKLEIILFPCRTGPPVQVYGVQMNEDGILLLQVNSHRRWGTSWDFRSGRDLIFFPGDNNLFWEQHYDANLPVPDHIPLLLGKNVVYCARMIRRRCNIMPDDEYVLGAVDFRTNQEVYLSPDLRFMGPTQHEWTRRITHIKLFRTNSGVEIIVYEPGPNIYINTRISVINGSNGQLIQKLDPSLIDLGKAFTHRCSDFITQEPLSWTPGENNDPIDREGLLEGYHLSLIKRFSRQLQDFLSPLAAVVVLSPAQDQSGNQKPVPIIQPAVMAGVSWSPSSDKPRAKLDVITHSAVQVKDSDLREAAVYLARRKFPSNAYTTENVFLLNEEELVRFPPRSQARRQGAKVQMGSARFTAKTAAYTDDGHIVLTYGRSKYLLRFN